MSGSFFDELFRSRAEQQKRERAQDKAEREKIDAARKKHGERPYVDSYQEAWAQNSGAAESAYKEAFESMFGHAQSTEQTRQFGALRVTLKNLGAGFIGYRIQDRRTGFTREMPQDPNCIRDYLEQALAAHGTAGGHNVFQETMEAAKIRAGHGELGGEPKKKKRKVTKIRMTLKILDAQYEDVG